MNEEHKSLHPTDWSLLCNALFFYIAKGYEYIELPWSVDKKWCEVTNNSEAFSFAMGSQRDKQQMIGSGEQAFLSMDLPPGRYVSCTPCFRNEKPDPTGLHQKQFIKVELFTNDFSSYLPVMMDAKEFFESLITHDSITIKDTRDGHDLMYNDIEIGSYGHRAKTIDLQYTRWVYGTGLALPRFSQAFDLAKKV